MKSKLEYRTLFSGRLATMLIILFCMGIGNMIFFQTGKVLDVHLARKQELLGDGNVRSVKQTGMLDRFEDNDLAIILMEELNDELVIPKHRLPVGSDVNTWFDIEETHRGFGIIAIDWKKTRKEAQRARKLMRTLKRE